LSCYGNQNFLRENFSITIMIAIKILIRINQTLIFIFQSRFDGKIFSRP